MSSHVWERLSPTVESVSGIYNLNSRDVGQAVLRFISWLDVSNW